MTADASTREAAVLYKKIDKTMYKINVRQSENAKDSAEDILVRLIARESINSLEDESDG